MSPAHALGASLVRRAVRRRPCLPPPPLPCPTCSSERLEPSSRLPPATDPAGAGRVMGGTRTTVATVRGGGLATAGASVLAAKAASL
jgi:hypothetical protein